MASRTSRPAGKGPVRPPEIEDSYPHIPEPKQGHTGSLLAFVSVLAVLSFGFWTALSTLTGGTDQPAARPSATVAATAVATVAPTLAPTAVASPIGTPSQSATPGPNSGKIHVVGQGDTLTKISQSYGTTVEAIMAANGITDRGKILHVGDRLTIP